MYKLVNAVKRNEESPNTFHIPTAEEISMVKVGTFVKLIFEENGQGERMWVGVYFAKDGHFEGMLDNEPVKISSLKIRGKVTFKSENIIDILKV